MTLGTWIWSASVIFEVLYILGVYSQFPPVMGTYFDAAGHATSSQNRGDFLPLVLQNIVIINAIFGFLYFIFTSATVQIRTNSTIVRERLNLPKAPTPLLTPEDPEMLAKKMRAIFALFGIFANLGCLLTFELLYQANVPEGAWILPLPWRFAYIALASIFAVALLFVVLRPFASKS